MSCYALGMRAVGLAAIFLVVSVSACFNETGPTTTPPDVAAPTGICSYQPSYPNPDPNLVLDAASLADAGDASDGDATLDAEPAVLEAGVDASPPMQGYCTPEPSVCANSEWVAYFDDGRCMGSSCNFTTKYHFCAGGCLNGLCAQHDHSVGGPTLAGPPPKW